MLNFFTLKVFFLCQVFLFSLYFFIVKFVIDNSGDGLSLFLLKKKTKSIIFGSFWFLAFLPLSVGFFYKFFIFLTGISISLSIFVAATLINTLVLIIYFFITKNSFMFFKSNNLATLKYCIYFAFVFNCFFFFIFTFLILCLRFLIFKRGLMLAINQRLLNEVTHAKFFKFFYLKLNTWVQNNAAFFKCVF